MAATSSTASVRAWPSERQWKVVDAVLSLYTASRSEVSKVLLHYYSENATFEDPLVRAVGREQVEGQFIALKGMVFVAECREVSLRDSDTEATESGSLPRMIVIDFLVDYRLSRLSRRISHSIRQTTYLEIGEDGLIEVHRDVWHNAAQLLENLPEALQDAYCNFRRLLGSASSGLVLKLDHLYSRLTAPLSSALKETDRRLGNLIAVDSLISPLRLVESLVDIYAARRLNIDPATFEGVTVLILGDFDDALLEIATSFVLGGALALHLVATSGPAVNAAAGRLRSLPRNASEPKRAPCAVTPHVVNFSEPEDVALWCWSFRQLLANQGRQTGLLVLGFFENVGEGALRPLLEGIRPTLEPRGRVVIMAAAASHWLQEDWEARSHQPNGSSAAPSSARSYDGGGGGGSGGGLDHSGGTGGVGDGVADHGDGMMTSGTAMPSERIDSKVEARARREAFRVDLAAKFGRELMALPTSIDCVSCTPGGSWSAWADLFSHAQSHSSVQALSQLLSWVPGSRYAANLVRRTMTRSAASTVLYLCSKSTYLSPGAYYWGSHRPIRTGDFGGFDGDSDAPPPIPRPPASTGQSRMQEFFWHFFTSRRSGSATASDKSLPDANKDNDVHVRPCHSESCSKIEEDDEEYAKDDEDSDKEVEEEEDEEEEEERDEEEDEDDEKKDGGDDGEDEKDVEDKAGEPQRPSEGKESKTNSGQETAALTKPTAGTEDNACEPKQGARTVCSDAVEPPLHAEVAKSLGQDVAADGAASGSVKADCGPGGSAEAET